MLYHSTRNASAFVDSAQAVLDGLAPDGGLYMPQALPSFDWQACLAGNTYHMATKILSSLLPDIPNMEDLVRKAYTGKFQTNELTPTAPVGKFTVPELCRGPQGWGPVHAAPAAHCRQGRKGHERRHHDPHRHLR